MTEEERIAAEMEHRTDIASAELGMVMLEGIAGGETTRRSTIEEEREGKERDEGAGETRGGGWRMRGSVRGSTTHIIGK